VTFFTFIDHFEQWARIGGSLAVMAASVVAIYYTIKNKGRK
jgi:hypothetical protein